MIKPPAEIAEAFARDVQEQMPTKDLCAKYGKHRATMDRYRQYLTIEEIAEVAEEEELPDVGSPKGKPNETQAFKGDDWDVTLHETRIHTLEDLIAHFEVDTTIWYVDDFIANKWEMGYKDKEGNAKHTPLYQVKARFKRSRAKEDVGAEIRAMIEECKTHAHVYTPIVRTRQVRPSLLQLSVPDLHLGKAAWHEETGENYDFAIAERLMRDSVDHLILGTQSYPIGKICFIVGNDMLHTDNNNNTTTRGTIQNVDGRHLRTFRKTRQLLVETIEKLRQIAPVDVLVVPGNHDQTCAFYLGDALECWFNNCPDVYVDNTAALRKYYQYGNLMLLFTHGSEEKQADLPRIMAQERPKMWGETVFREAHIGHLHQKRTMRSELSEAEYQGVRVRMLPSLSATDAWHYSKGYVGNVRSAEAYVWSPTNGLQGTAVYNFIPEDYV